MPDDAPSGERVPGPASGSDPGAAGDAGDAAQVRNLVRAIGLAVEPDAVRRLLEFRDYLVELNPRYSLVSSRDEARVVSRHFPDSIALLRWVPSGAVRVLDFGSGGGLPGIVIAILRPDSQVVLLEARHRKQLFLRLVASRLPLPNVRVASLISELLPDEGPPFDCVTARAIGSLRSLAREAAPLLRAGGLLLAPKGSRGESELEGSRTWLERAGLWLKATDTERLTPSEPAGIDRPTFVFEKRAPASG